MACAVFALVMMAGPGAARAIPFHQNSSPQESQSHTATIEGTLRDPSGAPIADATLVLEEKGSTTVITAKTNAQGEFVLQTNHAGTFTVRAKKEGWIDSVADAIALAAGGKKHLDLVLTRQGSMQIQAPASTPASTPSSSKTAPKEMEFNDEPSFTVAGVTDWSNLGLHGSAATSRASESLAKQTLTLKSGELGRDAGHAASGAYDAALTYREKGDFAGARAAVRKILATKNDAEGHRLLGELDEQLGDSLEAAHEYENAARMDPSEQNYFEWGTELLLHKAADPAVEVFTRGADAHPGSARMLTGLGAALFARGSVEDAAGRLCAASDLQPSDAAPYLFLGKIEKTVAAPLPCSEERLARFAQQQPGNAFANYYYAISFWKRAKESGDAAGLQKTEALLEKAVAADPKLDDAYLQLGVLHATNGELEEGIRDFQKAIEINPRSSEAHRQLGLAYQRKGEKAKAQQEFAAYEQAEKSEAAEVERQQKELRQFVITLKDQKATPPPQ
ncbi:MAG: tetratricopeptide repeat protein [Candidatus Acidiferrum sp.]